MEEWTYLGHKDLYKDFMMENRLSLTSRGKLDGSRNRNPAERCPRPLYSRDFTKKHHPGPKQSGNFRDNNIVVKEEIKEENEEYGLHKDFMMEQPSNRIPPERCPRPLYSRDSTQEDLTMPHHDQGESLINMKTEDEEEETYVSDDQQYTEAGMMRNFLQEDTPTGMSTGHEMEDEDVTQDCSGRNTMTSALDGRLRSVDRQTYHIDDEPPHTVRNDTGIQGWKTYSCLKCRENKQEAPHQQAEMSTRGSSQGRGGRSCPISSDGRGPQVQVTVSPRSAPLSSAVWAFFKTCAADRTVVICSLCQQRLRRGNTIGHLGTTCMKRHMSSYHATQWEQHLNASRLQPKGHSTTPPSSSCLSTTPTTIEDSLSAVSNHGGERLSKGLRGLPCGTSNGEDNLNGATKIRGKRRLQPCSDSVNPPPPSPDLALNRQVSLPQLPQCKEESASSPPHAYCLNASLTKLLALQLLPFQLVESAPFREFASCAAPHWQVPSQHFFSHKAIPALYHHVQGNVSTSLEHAISSRVHMTMDTWSGKHGQGHYISFTAHWVTMLVAGNDAGCGTPLEQVLPPRVLTSGDRSLISTFSMPYSTESSSESPVPPKRSPGYVTAKAKRCHAVLQLVFLRDKNHVGTEILTALQGQTQRWLHPCHLGPGMVMCDNSTNLLSALRQGKFTHVPCLAHVLNLVVQRFLVRYPGLQNLLKQARRVCSHFRRSYSASVRLGEIQRELHLPTNPLKCDMPTQWNSTLAMLQQLHMHQWAINKYLCEYGTRTGARELGFVSPHQWLLIQDACTILSPFEEAISMVSRDYACISDTIPVVFLLEHTLCGIIDQALQTQQKEDDYFLMSEDPLYPDFVPVKPQQAQEEEEFGCHGSEEEDLGQASRNGIHPSESQGVVRGWGEIAEDNVVLSDSEDSGSSASSNLCRLGSFMLQCLQKDPSICGIKERDHYWLATLLDPRYKEKVAELLLPSQREQKMKHLEYVLRKNLLNSFPGAGSIPFQGQRGLEPPVGERRNSVGGGCLSEAFKTFFGTQRPGLSAGRSYRQRLNQMVADYIGSRVNVDTLSTDDPLEYWVTRIDHWPELAQYATELLGCPAASILSEQTFNAAGGSVTEKRVDLSPDTVDQLTFVKMNQSWISNNYQAPAADTTN